MKALFICDNKEEWGLLRNLFHAHFSKVELICAIKASDALNYLSFEGPFSIIIIDCSIKRDDPSELAKEIFENTGERATIFIGTEAMLNDRVDQDFYMNHEMVFLYKKPFDPATFKSTVQESIDWAKREDFENSIVEINKEEYLPLKLKNFYLFDILPYDVYIELTKTKFVKVISANKKYTQSTIQDFQRRNVKFLYLHKNEHLKFLENSIEKITQTLKQKANKPKMILQAQIAGVLVIHQYLRDIGPAESIIRFSEIIIDSVPRNFKNFGELKSVLGHFPFENADLAEQAVLKAYICEALSIGLDWRSDLSRKKLGLSSIIHDRYLDNDEMAKVTHVDSPEFEMLNKDEQELLLEHPFKAAELARHFNGFTDVEFIIQEHQELPDGSGYPRGLIASKITSISAVFIIANNFVTQIAINGLSKVSIHNTVSGFISYYNLGNFKEPSQILKRMIKG